MTKMHPSHLLLLPLLVAALVRPNSSAVAQTNDLQPLVAANTAFALDLYSQLKVNDCNLFFSPYSISTCLAMTCAGARGNTEKQMAQVLHIDGKQAQFHFLFGTLQDQLNEVQRTDEIELDMANALWMQKGHPFLPAFLNTAQHDYQANLLQVNFHPNAESARQQINQWVDTKTRGKITGLIPRGMLNKTTQLVLANAIYFKGAWASPFGTNLSANLPFYVSGNRRVDVPFMNQVHAADYYSNSTFQAVRLPYINDQLSMVILLPNKPGGLKGTERALNPQSLAQCLGEMTNQKINIFLPKFKLEIGFNLEVTLAKMGMPDAFNALAANLSGVDGTHSLYISAILHKAYVDVNESGTEAAAATGIEMRPRGVRRPEPMPIFRADHPFVFLIRDDRSGTILFLGRVNDPTTPQ